MAETTAVRRDWCEEHNRGSLDGTDGICPECEKREQVWQRDPTHQATRPINAAALEAVLARASELNAQIDRLFLDAGAITGDTEVNGFTYEAVYNGTLTADELINTLAAGHYVREKPHV